MNELNVKIDRFFNEESINELISASEDDLAMQTDAPIREIVKRSGMRALLVDGPSCSGKSGFSALLQKKMTEQGILSKVISLTSFLKNESEYKEDCKKKGLKPNLSSLDALDFEYFEECLTLIKTGETALLPYYDRKNGVRSELIPFTLREGQVLILEGNGISSAAIKPLLEGFSTVTVEVELNRTYNSNVGRFSANDLRIARRFVRDGCLYGYPAERIYGDLETERAQARKYGTKKESAYDFSVDTTMAYEPLVLKKELHKVLGSVKSDSRYYASSSKFLSRLDTVPELDCSVLPEGSFYRTFL